MDSARRHVPVPWYVAAAGALLLVAALGAGSGPLLRLGPLGADGVPLPGSTAERPERPRPTLLPPSAAPERRSPGLSLDAGPLLRVLQVLALLLVAAAVVAAVVLAVRLVRRRAPAPEPAPAGTSGAGAPAAEREQLARALDAADDRLAGTGSARERVLGCWLRLEESVAETGVVRGPGETSAALTRRVLAAHAVRVRTLTELHALYTAARYSARDVAPGAAARARELLGDLRRDLVGEP